MKSRTHRKRKNRRLHRLRELIRERQVDGKQYGNHWRVNQVFDYWPNSGRVLDRRDPDCWIVGYVSGPDEVVALSRGVLELRNPKVTRRLLSWQAPWNRSPPRG